ncbi:MAG: ABC transporter ATP-binding protein [Phycisphaerales bacterium]
MIRMEDIHKTYRTGEIETPVLKGVTLAIERGEIVSLMGASGSGKTTLMNILGCLDRPTSGEYWLNGREVAHLSADERAAIRSSDIGFVFQSFNLLARTTALDNVVMPSAYSRIARSDREVIRRAKELLERVGLKDRMDHEPARLSGGQQQRVAIARALINDPSLVLADEPTGALDSKTSLEILGMLQRLNAESNITVVLVTHDADVAHHASRIIRVQDGVIVADDPSIGATIAAGEAGAAP